MPRSPQISVLVIFAPIDLFIFYFILLVEVQLSTAGFGNCFIITTKFEYTWPFHLAISLYRRIQQNCEQWNKTKQIK